MNAIPRRKKDKSRVRRNIVSRVSRLSYKDWLQRLIQYDTKFLPELIFLSLENIINFLGTRNSLRIVFSFINYEKTNYD